MMDPLFPRRQPCPCGSGKKFKDCCEVHVSGDHQVTVDAEKILQIERENPGTLSGMIAGFDEELKQRGGVGCS